MLCMSPWEPQCKRLSQKSFVGSRGFGIICAFATGLRKTSVAARLQCARFCEIRWYLVTKLSTSQSASILILMPRRTTYNINNTSYCGNKFITIRNNWQTIPPEIWSTNQQLLKVQVQINVFGTTLLPYIYQAGLLLIQGGEGLLSGISDQSTRSTTISR